uniref:Innexin n=1 Tax=Parastrongyloides trichosuri TaxID=131310 RepID=A0A0N4ZBL2_PARTI
MINGVDKFLKRIRASETTDNVDKMHYLTTVLWLLIVSSIGISRNMVGEPMQCWLATQVSRWEAYIENICYLRGGYRYENVTTSNVPMMNKIPVNYYAWVQPFHLLQAICFVVPFMIWKAVSKGFNFNPEEIVKKATIIKKNKKFLEFVNGNTMEIAKEAVDNLFKGLKKKSHYIERCKEGTFRKSLHRSFLTNCYTLFKFTNIINVILQMILICKFYGIPHFYRAGIDVMFGNSNKNEFVIGNSPYFPRIFTCNVTLQDIAFSTPTVVSDCVIRVNLYNEAFFIITWFWYVILLITSLTDFQAWVVNSYITNVRNSFIKNHLNCRSISLSDNEISKFINKTFYTDGVTVLRWIVARSGSNFTSDIIYVAYQKYKEDKKLQFSDLESSASSDINEENAPLVPINNKEYEEVNHVNDKE